MATDQNFLHELVGSMSQGASGNPTVAMVESAFAHHGLHWRYVNMEVTPANLGAAVRGAKALGFRGFNCSLPHKVAVIEHLDGLGESAAVMRAVNCVVRRDDRWIGENTDGKGFLKSLASVVDPRGKSVVLFGAGGAARAIAVELGLAGVKKIIVVNRSQERGSALVGLLREKLHLEAGLVIWTGDYAVPADTDIVINGTSIGLYDGDARMRRRRQHSAARHGRRGCHFQPSAHASPARCRGARLHPGRRPRHAGQSSDRRRRVLDRHHAGRRCDAPRVEKRPCL